jgi:CRISPR-associated endonuclease/helicase Cas3
LAERLAEEKDVLAIVHRREDARKLTETLDRLLDDQSTFHLSALMCPAHRRKILAEIKDRKNAGAPVRLVATQLVEAGVDLDFRVVYRAMAGFDSLAQAAGRCKLDGLGTMFVFLAETKPPQGILETAFQEASSMVMQNDRDLFDPDVQRRFFRRLYGLKDLDKKGLQPDRAALKFEAVASSYRLIDNDWSESLVIPYGESIEIARRLDLPGPLRDTLRKLHAFSVSVTKRDLGAWINSGLVKRHPATSDYGLAVLAANSDAYDARFGLIPDRVGRFEPDSLIS